MDSFFLDPTGLNDPSEVPLPPQLVRIRELSATPWPDGRRVRVYLEVDPFQKRPNAEVKVHDAQDRLVAEASIIETAIRKMEFNLHLRQPETAGDYAMDVVLYYEEGPVLTVAADGGAAPMEGAPLINETERQVVDERRIRFTVL
jgi:hypothetical protein